MERDDVRGRLTPLLVGEDRATTRRALLLAGGFVVGFAAAEYVVLLGTDADLVDALWGAFVLEANLVAAAERGSFGAHLWTIGSLAGVANLHFDPASAIRRVFPEAAVFAAVGFLLGVGLRRLRVQRRERRTDDSATRDAQ